MQPPENRRPTQRANRPLKIASRPVSSPPRPYSTWAVPTALLDDLDGLAARPVVAAWAIEASARVRRLTAAPEATERETRAILEELTAAIAEADRLAADTRDPQLRTQLLQTRHGLARRVDVWGVVFVLRSSRRKTGPDHGMAPANTAIGLGHLMARIGGAQCASALRNHLLVEGLVGAIRSDTLLQLLAPGLGDGLTLHVGRIASGSSRALADSILLAELREAWPEFGGDKSVDLGRLLSRIEVYERTGRPEDAGLVADDLRVLAHSQHAGEKILAERLTRHYRNANVRIAVTGRLMNHLLPRLKTEVAPVRDTILGADVEGYSFTTTRLRVRLLPDQRRWRLGLEAYGSVQSDTESFSGPAVFYSAGYTDYVARKLLVVRPDGLFTSPASAAARSDSDLLSVDTSFDSVPLVGSLVRGFAISQHDQARDQALMQVEQKVEAMAGYRLDVSCCEKLNRVVSKIEKRAIDPLNGLGLDPTPLEMQTTADRIVARIRLAGRDQLGSHTPRPRAPAGSLASAQIHESALNNAVLGLQLDGQTFTLPELYQGVAMAFGFATDVPSDIPKNARVTFADEDAVRVRCADGKIELTLAIAELAQNRSHYKNFRVRAYYEPVADGLDAHLIRNSGIQLQGDRLRPGGQIVLRGVFSKLLSRNRKTQIIGKAQQRDPRMAGLQVSQLVIDGGWIGLALGPERTPAATAQSSRPSLGTR